MEVRVLTVAAVRTVRRFPDEVGKRCAAAVGVNWEDTTQGVADNRTAKSSRVGTRDCVITENARWENEITFATGRMNVVTVSRASVNDAPILLLHLIILLIVLIHFDWV